jgi:hypothetical protein
MRGTVAKRLRKVAHQLTDHITSGRYPPPARVDGMQTKLYKRGKQLFNQRTRRIK